MILLPLVVCATGCKTEATCRPNTLFVRTLIGADFQAADALVVSVTSNGSPTPTSLAPFTRAPGTRLESFEIAFARYTANQSITLDISATENGQVIASGTRTVRLLEGCTFTEVNLEAIGGGGTDMGATDLASWDMTVIAGAPAAPTGVVSVAKIGGKFALSWAAPTDTGSAPISGYAIDSDPPGLSTTTPTLNYTTPALNLGTSYTFNVRAINSVGPGPAGVSNAAVAGDVPSAPTNVSAIAPSGGRATATWTAANDNGYPVLSYLVVASPGGKSVQVNGSMTTATVTGLAAGTVYTLTVSATNDFGSGPGAVSNSVTANCANNSYTLYALDSATVQYGTPPQTVAETSITAQRDLTSPYNSDLRGWAKFSVSVVPDYAQITSLKLFMKVGTSSGSPTPALEIWYSSNDNWNRAAIPTSADITPTLLVSGQYPPAASGTFQTFDIIVSTRDWSSDLADNIITLGVKNTALPAVNASSTAQYYGSDNVPAGTKPYIILGVCE